ncbi:MAG TPA: hypothetical protein VF773_21695 [Verrucomicrobiae bacterium]
MKPNPILEETWKIKDQIAREADYDLAKLCAQTRAWAAANLHSSPLIPDAEKAEAVEAVLRESPRSPN